MKLLYHRHLSQKHVIAPLHYSGQIAIIPKPELRCFGGDSLTDWPSFGVISAEVANFSRLFKISNPFSSSWCLQQVKKAPWNKTCWVYIMEKSKSRIKIIDILWLKFEKNQCLMTPWRKTYIWTASLHGLVDRSWKKQTIYTPENCWKIHHNMKKHVRLQVVIFQLVTLVFRGGNHGFPVGFLVLNPSLANPVLSLAPIGRCIGHPREWAWHSELDC